ncbi:PAS domain S-box protein [Propionispora hippei]|uniref:histidine kinase n=1 Tax=Propionispora hippei DSM 15287 TaxID=1123003 RepID=A0A1M6NRF5_9FIRM|nr:PAS domain S-box protein [Propionispora hippei]SHJ98303.1 PAS domain S-box-containing protein [Propionispora hippei DSM 15287]
MASIRQGVAQQTYVVITILMTIATIIVGTYYIVREQDRIVHEQEFRLFQAAVELALQIPKSQFDNKIKEAEALPVAPEKRATVINDWLQPILQVQIERHPGFGMGIYARGIDRIVAIGPDFDDGKLQQGDETYFSSAYVSGKAQFSKFKRTLFFNGKPVNKVIYPISYQGHYIGHVWVCSKTEDLNPAMLAAIVKVIGVALLLWSIILLTLRMAFRKLQTGLRNLANQIRNQDFDRQSFASFPELLPVFDTIVHLRGKLNDECLQGMKAHEELALFVDLSVDMIFVRGFDGSFKRINPAVTKQLGYCLADLTAPGIIEKIHPRDMEGVLEAWSRVLAGEPCLQYENRCQAKNGEYRWLAWNAMPSKEHGLIYLVARDITEQKTINQKLLTMASIVEYFCDGIVGLAPDGTIQSWNREAENLLGYSAAEAMGKRLSMFCVTDCGQKTKEVIGTVKVEEKVQNYQCILQRKNGLAVDVSITVSHIWENNGDLAGLSATIRDITQQKKMERDIVQMDRLQTIGQMAAGISHEVRNPMTTVRGFLQMIGRRPQYAKDKEYFDLMIEELDRANTIIKEFLSISDTKVHKLEACKLNQVIEAILPLLQADALEQGKNLEVDLRETGELLLNPKEIRQLILNLVRNGLEAMAAGGLATIRTYSRGRVVVLEITDQGTGIPPEILDRLGTPFLTTKENGTGLGLGVCYGIAERHHAKIDVATGPGGTTFYVSFDSQYRDEDMKQ